MLDLALRSKKEAILAPVVERVAPRVHPAGLTALALAASIGAAFSVSIPALAVGLWWVSRLFDGLDGPVARFRKQASDFGGYLDMVGDTIGYAVIPLGVAFYVDQRTTWIAVAVMLAVLSINTISWTYLSAIAEKRGQGVATSDEMTTITMPPALIEGTETIVVYTLFLALPGLATWLFAAFAVAVSINIVQRVLWAGGNL